MEVDFVPESDAESDTGSDIKSVSDSDSALTHYVASQRK